MKKTFAGLGVLALVALGATGASFPANAVEVQPVTEIVAASDAIVASPDAALTQSEPLVITSPAPEPVAVVAEPVVAPVAPAETLVITEVIAVVAEAPVASEPVAVAPAEQTAPEPAGKPVYAGDGTLTTPDYAYTQEQLDAMNLAARTREEGHALGLHGYTTAQDANAPLREGYVYTPSVVDPTKVHVSMPVWELPAAPNVFIQPYPYVEPTPTVATK